MFYKNKNLKSQYFLIFDKILKTVFTNSGATRKERYTKQQRKEESQNTSKYLDTGSIEETSTKAIKKNAHPARI